MKQRMLVVVAHPDDESFGPAGTLALYASRGVEIHLICVTNGDASEVAIPGEDNLTPLARQQQLAKIRQEELHHAANIIGVTQIDFLNYPDGQLCNALYHAIAHDIMAKITQFCPHVIMAPEPQGISGHLDHIAVSMITTYAFIKTTPAKKLYYTCLPKEIVSMSPSEDYFVYFPPGYDQSVITTRIDYHAFSAIKIQAMQQHVSQMDEVNRLLEFTSNLPKIDYFILHRSRIEALELPETDLFAGIS